MKFTDFLKEENQIPVFDAVLEKSQDEISEAEKKSKKPIDLLRDAGFKIKLVTPTSFGTQIDFAREYEKEEIEDILKNFSIKIKNKSVFIVD